MVLVIVPKIPEPAENGETATFFGSTLANCLPVLGLPLPPELRMFQPRVRSHHDVIRSTPSNHDIASAA